MQLLNIWNMAYVTEELNVYFYLILINLSLSICMWLVATVPDSKGLGVY